MISHRVKRHKSAKAIVREFLGPQLRVLPEELIWVPAHPSFPDDGGFSYDEMLRAVRSQKRWAFVRIPHDGKIATLHFWAAKSVRTEDVAHMLGHELGHLSGDILANDAAEEDRADQYGDVVVQVLRMLKRRGARRRTGQMSSSRTSRSDRASRHPPAGGTSQDAARPASSTPPKRVRAQGRRVGRSKG